MKTKSQNPDFIEGPLARYIFTPIIATVDPTTHELIRLNEDAEEIAVLATSYNGARRLLEQEPLKTQLEPIWRNPNYKGERFLRKESIQS